MNSEGPTVRNRSGEHFLQSEMVNFCLTGGDMHFIEKELPRSGVEVWIAELTPERCVVESPSGDLRYVEESLTGIIRARVDLRGLPLRVEHCVAASPR